MQTASPAANPGLVRQVCVVLGSPLLGELEGHGCVAALAAAMVRAHAPQPCFLPDSFGPGLGLPCWVSGFLAVVACLPGALAWVCCALASQAGRRKSPCTRMSSRCLASLCGDVVHGETAVNSHTYRSYNGINGTCASMCYTVRYIPLHSLEWSSPFHCM